MEEQILEIKCFDDTQELIVANTRHSREPDTYGVSKVPNMLVNTEVLENSLCPLSTVSSCTNQDSQQTRTGLSKKRNKEKRFKCSLCSYQASRTDHMRRHIETVHFKKKKYSCHHCCHKSSTLSDLRRHITAVHLKKGKFKCTQCSYRAFQESSLKMHIEAVHLKKRKFACNLCDYKTCSSSTLYRHVRAVHEKLKLFQCPYCPYRAAASFHMKRHISRIHEKTDEKLGNESNYVAFSICQPLGYLSKQC